MKNIKDYIIEGGCCGNGECGRGGKSDRKFNDKLKKGRNRKFRTQEIKEQEEQEKYYWSISELRPSSANNGELESYACVEDSATSDDANQEYFPTPDEAYSDGLEQLKYYDGVYALEVYHFINGAGDYVSGYYAEIHNGEIKEY